MSTSPINVSSLLSAFGLGGASTIDVNSIVSQLMLVDEQPLTNLQTQVTDYQTKISAYGSLVSSLSSLQTAVSAMQNSTTGLSATSSNSSYFTATGSSTATTGSTPIQISNIASAQSLYSTRFGSRTSSVADLSVDQPSENLQIKVGSNTSTIAITSANNTLSGIASAINSANIGATASVVKESSNFVIDSSNSTIAFSYNGHSYSAALNAGNYSGADMATEIARAMNAATSGGSYGDGSPFAADYSTTSLNKLTIKNNGTAGAQINWAVGSTATPQQFGFESGVQSPTIAANGGNLTGADTVDGTYKLALTSASTGTANRITVKVDEAGGTAYGDTDKFGLSVLAFNPTNGGSYNSSGVPSGGIENMTQSQVGLDAQLSVNGVNMYRSSNTVTDAVTGVTLNLLQKESSPGTDNLSVNVSLDSSTLANNLKSLVSTYNYAMTAINMFYNPYSSSSSSSSASQYQGYLNGDSILLMVKQQLTALPSTVFGTSSNPLNNSLASIGVTTDKNGTMAFDSSALSSAYTSSNAGDITKMINNFANQLGSTLSNVINVSIPGESQAVQSQVMYAQNQEATLQEQLTYEQQSLTTEYSALANYMANASSISSYLTTQTSLMTKQTGSL